MSATHASVGRAPSLSAMAKIETKRLARNPFFILATLVSFGLPAYWAANSKHNTPGDLLSWPVVPAFFVGLTSLVLLARQTRSTEGAAEAMAASPGSEARRTQALIVACLLPAAVGLAFMVEELVIAGVKPTAPQEWWFATMNDAQVLAMMFGGTVVACFGGALLGVLSGRWVRFRGASAVIVVGLVVLDIIGQVPADAQTVLIAPWMSWQSGTDTDGTATLYAGNAIFYVVYILCLCAAAGLVAIWHDKDARSQQLKSIIAAVTVTGLVALGLAMITGQSDNKVSDPVPWHIKK